MRYQFVTPHYHNRNSEEQAIRTFKEHFISVLSAVDLEFPMLLWVCLLPQSEIILNFLCNSRLHPHLYAADNYHSLVDYNKTSFAPLGCNIVSQEKPTQLLMSKCVHHIKIHKPHRGHFVISLTQFSDSENILYRPTRNHISKHD